MTTPPKKNKIMKSMSVTKYADDIKNPKNAEYVAEVAFNKGKDAKKVTQEEFDKRYKAKANSTKSMEKVVVENKPDSAFKMVKDPKTGKITQEKK
jgi:hypothetical protein